MHLTNKTVLVLSMLVWAGHAHGVLMCACPGPDKPLGDAPDCQVACFGESPSSASTKAAQDAAKAAANKKQSDANKAATEQKKKLDALKRQQEAAEQRVFDQNKLKLLNTVKGVAPSDSTGAVVLKPIPPAKNQARSQLDCIARTDLTDPTRSWDGSANDCTPVAVRVPKASPPTAVEEIAPADPALLAQFLAKLGLSISTSRATLEKQDQVIADKESEIAREEKNSAASAKPVGESEVLKRARAALAKAKADRARTAAELERLEKQEADVRNQAASKEQ